MLCESVEVTKVPRVKRCSKCGKTKPTSDFRLRPSRKSGLQSQCKLCEKEYRDAHKGSYFDYYKQRRKDSPNSAIYNRLWAALKRFPTENPVTKEELVEIWDTQKGKCALSGIEMVWQGSGGKAEYNSLSLDRIDNGKGYTKDNVRWICHCVNSFKGRMTDMQMYEVIEALIINRIN